MILLVQNDEKYNNDLRAMLMAFYPGEKIQGVTPVQVTEYSREMHEEFTIVFTALFSEEQTLLKIERKGQVKFSAYASGNYNDKKRFRNKLKLASYRILSEYTGLILPWGSLTGVRPTKIAMEEVKKGHDKNKTIEYYDKTYMASHEKAAISYDIAVTEKRIIDSISPTEDYCLYVGIPFCPSRCLYCSFTSYPIHRYKGLVGAYLKAVEQELQFTAFAYRHKRLVSIYIGGGTPSSIEAEDIDRLCTMIEENFDMSNVREFTIEAGRPDSITEEKLRAMKKHKVTRISINPQTMNQKTLQLIGRAHTPEQAEYAFKMARAEGFDNINMDLIVGLPGENLDMVKKTLEKVKELSPESLTVHSLAIKRAANLNIEMEKYRDSLNRDARELNSQISLTGVAAKNMGLHPYYLYRQKNIAGNLENTGYSKPGLECLYNILIMEEITDIVGIGAGSSSKIVMQDGTVDPIKGDVVSGTRIERCENCKSVEDYIERIDEMIERKHKAWAL